MALISRLNPLIKGWSNYYSPVASKRIYSRLDYLMYLKLRRWAKRRHPKKKGGWVSSKYWQTIGGSNWDIRNQAGGYKPNAVSITCRNTNCSACES